MRPADGGAGAGAQEVAVRDIGGRVMPDDRTWRVDAPCVRAWKVPTCAQWIVEGSVTAAGVEKAVVAASSVPVSLMPNVSVPPRRSSIVV